jgi:hypothetical protein
MVLGTEAQSEAAHYDSKTASSLLFDFFAVGSDSAACLDTYRAERVQPLLDNGAATGANIFELREQQVPAARLAQNLGLGLTAPYQESLWLQLDRGAAGSAVPDRSLPEAVYGAAYQLVNNELSGLDLLPKNDRLSIISSSIYSKISDYGRPNPTGEDAFQSAMIIFTHPTDLGYVESFNDWYTNNHMIDVAKSPPYRSASRYLLQRSITGTPLPYLGIYEIEAPYSEQVHVDMMQQVGVDPWPLRELMPITAGGQGILMIDLWGYFQRIWYGK